jgi:hypothetical protein
MGPVKEKVITVAASSIPRRSLARNNRNLLASVNVDVDIDDGAADTQRIPV